nr:MAG TPA: hypothetical protein [Caudoviricetes sp.]
MPAFWAAAEIRRQRDLFFISSLSSFLFLSNLPPMFLLPVPTHPTSHLSPTALLPCSGQLAALPLAQRAGLIKKGE